jgi:hypothetical protein
MVRPGGAVDAMLLEAVKESYLIKSSKNKFKLKYIWCTLCHQHKWCAMHDYDNSIKTIRLNLDDEFIRR